MVNYFVPVVDLDNNPLMPTNINRAFRWINYKKATPFYKKGIFCVRLNYKKENIKLQEIGIGIDPGSKKEGFTVKSKSHTYINIQTDAVTWVKGAVKLRRLLRRGRRYRKTPYRKCRFYRKGRTFPPSTKARWQWKLRIIDWMMKLFPISVCIIEDIKARKIEGKRNWNKSFSPLETGKQWFYNEIIIRGLNLFTKEGCETKALRDKLNLTKSKNKLSGNFDAHCVDSWALVNSVIGENIVVDNKKVMCVKPLIFHRRQLHEILPKKKGFRKLYGGTRSMGFKRGSLVKHKKLGLCYVGGTSKGKISLHSLNDGNRLGRTYKAEDCKFLCYNSCL